MQTDYVPIERIRCIDQLRREIIIILLPYGRCFRCVMKSLPFVGRVSRTARNQGSGT